MEQQPFLAQLRGQRYTVRRIAPIRLMQLHAVPGLVGVLDRYASRLTRAAARCSTSRNETARDQQLHESVYVSVFLKDRTQSSQLVSLSWQ